MAYKSIFCGEVIEMSEAKTAKKKMNVWTKVWIVFACLVAYSFVFFAIAGEDVDYKADATQYVDGMGNVSELIDGVVIDQAFTTPDYKLTGVGLNIGTYARTDFEGLLNVELTDGSNTLATKSVELKDMVNGGNEVVFDEPVLCQEGTTYHILISTQGAVASKSVTLITGVNRDEHLVKVNGKEVSGESLSFIVRGKISDNLGGFLRFGVLAILIALGVYIAYLPIAEKKHKHAVGLDLLNAAYKYRFLISQLVSRDFKVRYKRSVLGVLWSFINPLLTMMVQFVVFSTIFKSGIHNYIAYLLVGITFFSFYSESTNNGLLSITTNASLIKKVYVPKYIYPLSSVLSSSINFCISLILMFVVTFITGVAPSWYMLLFPYTILCIFILNMGVSLVIGTGMVFFHDVQFLYNVFMTLLSYATPLFWSLDMMPAKYQSVFKLNPLADIVMFARACVLDGKFPGSLLTILSFVIPTIIFMIGVKLFRSNQDKFVLYI